MVVVVVACVLRSGEAAARDGGDGTCVTHDLWRRESVTRSGRCQSPGEDASRARVAG